MKCQQEKTKVDIAYESIRIDIINLKYHAGDVLNEKDLADKLNMSKTPVREALSQLVAEGYLLKYPRYGYVIREINLVEFYQISHLRFILESGCIRMVIDNATDQEIHSLHKLVEKKYVPFEDYHEENMRFHLALADLLKNPYISKEVERVHRWLNRDISKIFYNRVSGDIHVNHRQMIKALENRDLETAISILREELRRSDDDSTTSKPNLITY